MNLLNQLLEPWQEYLERKTEEKKAEKELENGYGGYGIDPYKEFGISEGFEGRPTKEKSNESTTND